MINKMQQYTFADTILKNRMEVYQAAIEHHYADLDEKEIRDIPIGEIHEDMKTISEGMVGPDADRIVWPDMEQHTPEELQSDLTDYFFEIYFV